ncbi:uncharacterized protein LOC124809590 isoform X1 [Hydra vulgaris]|uniref:uncharacterized protein LOC124809590 isoform X1 n=1 Tax=Hydra vulgaris TaxID=6087 RepID=UPI0032E9E378
MDEVESVSFAIKKANTEKKNFFKAIIYTPHLRKCTPSIEDKKKVKQSTNIKSHILVTDHKGFSGAESESVIIFVDPNDIYLRHTVINAMARSNSHLTFLVLGKIVLHSENSVGSIITEWTSEWIDKIEIKPNNCAYGKEEFEAYRKKEKFEINMEHDNMYKIKASQTAELAKKGKSDTKKNEYESTDFELTKSEKTELKKRMDDREYRGFPNIADYLFDRDVEKIKFYYSKEIGDADLKRITTPIELIQTLEDRMLLGNGDYISFVEVLRKIGRNDLAGYLTWKSDTRKNENIEMVHNRMFPDEQVLYRRDFMFYFSAMVGVDWRTLGRQLNINENSLEIIDNDNLEIIDNDNDVVKSKAYSMLNIWMKRFDTPTLKELKTTLRNMNRMDLIRQIDEYESNFL